MHMTTMILTTTAYALASAEYPKIHLPKRQSNISIPSQSVELIFCATIEEHSKFFFLMNEDLFFMKI